MWRGRRGVGVAKKATQGSLQIPLYLVCGDGHTRYKVAQNYIHTRYCCCLVAKTCLTLQPYGL